MTFKSQAFLRDGDEDVRADGEPDLRFDCVLAGAQELRDCQFMTARPRFSTFGANTHVPLGAMGPARDCRRALAFLRLVGYVT